MGYVDTGWRSAKLENASVAPPRRFTTGMAVISGDSHPGLRRQQIARDVICRIGYDRAEYGFDGHACGVITIYPRPKLGHRAGCGREF